jgi:hypothetical protein
MPVDILGPFPRIGGGCHFLYVSINKFTKLPEATGLTTIIKAFVVKLFKSIECYFGIPNWIITYHRSQF